MTNVKNISFAFKSVYWCYCGSGYRRSKIFLTGVISYIRGPHTALIFVSTFSCVLRKYPACYVHHPTLMVFAIALLWYAVFDYLSFAYGQCQVYLKYRKSTDKLSSTITALMGGVSVIDERQLNIFQQWMAYIKVCCVLTADLQRCRSIVCPVGSGFRNRQKLLIHLPYRLFRGEIVEQLRVERFSKEFRCQ